MTVTRTASASGMGWLRAVQGMILVLIVHGIVPVTKPPLRSTYCLGNVTVKLSAAVRLQNDGHDGQLRCDGVTVTYYGAQNVKVPLNHRPSRKALIQVRQ
jgi:hypothetical protein